MPCECDIIINPCHKVHVYMKLATDHTEETEEIN